MRFKMLKLLILTVVLVVSQTRRPGNKRQREIWRMECELGLVADPGCPVDGGWTPWSKWSSCHGMCDQIGHKTRTRYCTNPPPSLDGIACNGPENEKKQCYITNCTSEDYRILVRGDPSRTEALRQLEIVPALMERCLHLECPFEAIEGALAVDNTWQINAENVWNALLCVKHNMGCPVKGKWGAWGHWSTCGARCGTGIMWRLRKCDSPSPSEARYVCSGKPLDAKPCEGNQCAIEQRRSSGTWAEWGKWSICLDSCGVGVRRRRRTCLESQTSYISGSWGTHCRGQNDQLEVCKAKECVLNGGWSGWGPWGPCSQTCGAGRRTKSRSCTRPIPAGGGEPCAGPRTEVESCYVVPCYVKIHTVALFGGESYLQYDLKNRASTLFHFYIRFMPLSSHGTLVRRGSIYDPNIRLSLQKWHICLDASGLLTSCSIPRICSHNTIEPAVWHTAMVTVSSKSAALRFDNDPEPMQAAFPCEPYLPSKQGDVIVGGKFYGEIQEIIVNFKQLHINIDRKRRKPSKFEIFPILAKNVAYEAADLEEAYILLDNEYFMRIPCFNPQDEWQLELIVKPKRECGTILFLTGLNQWLHVALQNSRVIVKLAVGNYRSDSMSATEYPKDNWLDITITKKQGTGSIEALINGGERLHVLIGSDTDRKRRKSKSKICEKPTKDEDNSTTNFLNLKLALCVDEYFVGGVPEEIKNKIPEDFTHFSGIISAIGLNSILYDLHEIGQERYKDNRVQVSSKTASVSDFYHEITWGMSDHLNLSCLHARQARSSHDAQWIILDTGHFTLNNKGVRVTEDGRILRLISTSGEDFRGFYTCRAYVDKFTHNIVTYGILGKTNNKLSTPDTITAIAIIITLTLATATLGWLCSEIVTDLYEGHGFFRDGQLTPNEEADAVCEYIDNHQDLVGSASAATLNKALARRQALNCEAETSFAEQEPQGLTQETRLMDENVPCELALPALSENTCCHVEASHDLFRFEPNYVSTPQHGSITSPKKKLTSSSSVDVVSPRILCSRIIGAKRRLSPRASLAFKKKMSSSASNTRKFHPNNWEQINWKSNLNRTAAQKILRKFQQLQSDL